MEAGDVSTDAGQSSPQTETCDSPADSPTSPPLLPPARPTRPKPPPPASKSTPLPACPPPTLPPAAKALFPLSSVPPCLPLPLSPTTVPSSPPPCSPSNLTAPSTSASTPPSLPPPLAPTVLMPPSVEPSPCGKSPPLSTLDRLLGSSAMWKPRGANQDQVTSILEGATAGAFLVHSKDGRELTMSVRLPEQQGAPLVHHLPVKQHKTFVHLEGSSLVFDDIFKLISFYSVSRDILAIPLRLPQAVATATKREELEVITAMGADFWMSSVYQQEKNQQLPSEQEHSRNYLYVDPITFAESTNEDLEQATVRPWPSANDTSSTSASITNSTTNTNTTSNTTSNSTSTSSSNGTSTSSSNSTPSLQNGELQQPADPEVKGSTKISSNQDTKYKRPPPRPPSLGSGSGMGLLFSSPPPPLTLSSAAPAAKRKEEVCIGASECEERKSMPVSSPPPPSRPPVPLQGRSAPLLPPAPLRRVPSSSSSSSRKSCSRDVGDGKGREKGQNPAAKMEHDGGGRGGGGGGEEQAKSKAGPQGETAEQGSGAPEEEQKRKEKGSEEKEKETAVEGNKDKCIQQGKRPSRPVPPPRRKPGTPDSPVCPVPPSGGGGAGGAGFRGPPPSAARRPDVSLYSPQGGSVVGADPDSCSNSSTEEEGEQNQESEQTNNRVSGGRSPKVKRTPTTIMLDRARYRLSTVITGLISHERRLTQRIVELTRDPLSYFGNLVKEHRAFTLETMSNHSSPTELLQEIRQMVTQLKSYLLQSTELQAMLEPQHQYTPDKLESIVEAAMCKSVLKPLREAIYQRLEKLHASDGSHKLLAQKQSVVLGSTTTALGITTAVPEAPAMEKISIKLNNLHLEYSPQKKIELLLKACKIIYDSMSVSCPGRAHGADDFLPVMMYVLARSNLSNLQLDVEYMMELMDPSLALGEGSYYLTTTYGALEHIKSFDQQRSATRQLSREVQDSIHRWERRRTLNQERMAQSSVRDFLTVCCPEIGANAKTLGVLPNTTIQQLEDQCAARFEQNSFTLSLYIDGVLQPLDPTELAVNVKNRCHAGAYCFVYQPADQAADQPNNQLNNQLNNQQVNQLNNQLHNQLNNQRVRTCPSSPPPAPPAQSFFPAGVATAVEQQTAEESLISL